MKDRLVRYLRYAKLSLLVVRYNHNYRPKTKIKYLFLSWHHDLKQPMYLTMDFNKTESMGGDVWADQFSPMFNRKLNSYDSYLAEHVTEISKLLDPQKLNTIKQKMYYFIAFGHITRLLKGRVYIVVYQRNRHYINLLAPYLASKYPDTKIIVQYIDTVSLDKISDIDEYKRIKNAEIYSFDRKDVAKFNLKHFNWYVDDRRLLKYSKINPTVDVVFIGEDKGKVAEIKNLEKTLIQQNISYNWHVIFNEDFERSIGVKKDKKFKYSDEYLSTFDYQKKCCEARVILELLQQGQTGPTLDMANAIFLRRKLITNNKNVVDEACYDKQNIFILGVDNPKELSEFIKTPYRVLPSKVTEKYTYEYMLKQIDEGNNK